MDIQAKSVDGINDLIIEDAHREITARAWDSVSVLDLGTAEGYNIAKLDEKIPSNIARATYLGVDIDPSGFKPTTSETCRLIPFDLNRDFSFGKFDIVLATEVIEHVENPYHFIRNALRHVSDRGILYVSTPNLAGLYSAARFLLLNAPAYFENDASLEHISPVSSLTIAKALEMARKETGTNWKFMTGYTPNVIKLPTGSMKPNHRSTWVKLPGNSRLLSQVVYFKIQRA